MSTESEDMPGGLGPDVGIDEEDKKKDDKKDKGNNKKDEGKDQSD